MINMTKREGVIVAIIAGILVIIIMFGLKNKYEESGEPTNTIVKDIKAEQEQYFNIDNYGNNYVTALDNSVNTVNNNVNTLQNKELTKLQDINIKINDKNYIATIYNNEAGIEFLKQLPLKLTLSELNGNEKYTYLSIDFTQDKEKTNKITKGDIMLYGSNCLTIFYKDTMPNYTYTKIGKIENSEELESLSEYENVEVEFSIIE